MEITRNEAIASDMAQRHYDEKITPMITELNSDEAKRGYLSTILMRAGADLFHVANDDYEARIDDFVSIFKEQARKARNQN